MSPKKKGLKTKPDFPVMRVSPEELAETIYKELKMSFPEPTELERVENMELFRDRGNLRPLRKSSGQSFAGGEGLTEMESEEIEEEEEEGVTTEEEEDVLVERKQKRTTTKDDVVHCMCSNNLDEGFMIQVSSVARLSCDCCVIVV